MILLIQPIVTTTVTAFFGGERNGHQAEWATFFRWRGRRRGLVMSKFIDHLNQNKNGKRHDEKIQNIINKKSVV
jgi:hypothetical protein